MQLEKVFLFQASMSAYGLSTKEVKQHRAAAKIRQLTNIVKKRKLPESSADNDSEVAWTWTRHKR